jgi:UV DNA damage endonuclease
MKIGAACKWLNEQRELVPSCNFRQTTVTGLKGLSESDRHNKLMTLVDHNLSAMLKVVTKLGQRPEPIRMWRFGSDVLPVYTHEVTRKFYDDPDVRTFIEQGLAKVGEVARAGGVRLSFHPGQFCVIGSRSEGVRSRTLVELYYHAYLADLMGYRDWHQDGFCINVHTGPKDADVKTVRRMLKQMDSRLGNLITLENDEFSWGARQIVENFGDLVPLVLDVHHYWIMHGKRFDPQENDQAAQQIIDTWRGVRPKLHLAMSGHDMVPEDQRDGALSLESLMLTGLPKGKLRIHSGSPWHVPTLDYIAKFSDWDVMWEGGDKALGQKVIARHLGLIPKKGSTT